jgi:uncharacterized membrane protein
MTTKSIKITYRSLNILFFIAMFMDGIGGVTRAEAGVEVMKHLGYPVYVLSIFGVAKLLGALAILQNRIKNVKEWAYAGFLFTFIGAIMSRAFVLIPPLIMIVYLATTYVFWKKFEHVQSENSGSLRPAF